MNDILAVNILSLLCITPVGLAVFSFFRLRKHRLSAVFTGVAIPSVIIGGYLFWYVNRTVPNDSHENLFEGIEYIREVRTGTIIINVIRINLQAAGIQFLVTPGQETNGYDLPARTTSQFLSEFKLQLAINGDFFDPWRDNLIWDYYPHVGDGVNARGLTASAGYVYTNGYSPDAVTVYISENNRVSFEEPIDEMYNAISGNIMLIENGRPVTFHEENSYLSQRHPRTVLATDESGNTLILILIDGRQPNYSIGVTIAELIEIASEYGSYNALNLDGGGSVTLVIEGKNGEPVVLNSPIHSRIPGLERPIANHLGVYAERLDEGN